MNLTNDKANPSGWQDMNGLILEKDRFRLRDEDASF
jgi:hypothetical protein